jgi:mono/diheme cytochrome c family protein
MILRHRLAPALGLPLLLGSLLAAAAAADEAELARGRYLVAIMDCGGCHTPGALAGRPDPGRPLAGSDIGFEAPPLGIFYPPNLTPDAASGLGSWSTEDIVRAVREGQRPDGRELAPVMPWHAYAALTDEDARALAAYLKSLPPVAHQVPDPVGPEQRAPAPYLTVVPPG